VTNQAVGPGNTGDILYFMRVLLFVAFLSMGYALSRPNPSGSDKQRDLLLSDIPAPDSPEQNWSGLQPWQKKVSEKAIERYAAAQDKKWRSWNEAMFERSS
jgi:hypothetical protein